MKSFIRSAVAILIAATLASACSESPATNDIWNVNAAITKYPNANSLAPVDLAPAVVETADGIPTISEQDARLRLIGWTRPEFAASKSSQMAQGEVLVEVTVDPDGAVSQARSLRGDRRFAKLLSETIIRWKFKPHEALPNGFKTRFKFSYKINPYWVEVDLGDHVLSHTSVPRRTTNGHVPSGVPGGVPGCIVMPASTPPRLPYPKIEISPDVRFSDARVVISGIVDEDGYLQLGKIVNSPDPAFDQSALALARYFASSQYRSLKEVLLNQHRTPTPTTLVLTFQHK